MPDTDRPFSFEITLDAGVRLSEYDNHFERKLSAMEGQYVDEKAYQRILERGDPTLYEVYEVKRPPTEGELLHGLSVVHPGKVGDEYFMTKGHFHTVLDTAEIYYGLRGQGYLVMETPVGDWAIEPMEAGVVVYVPPRWAHRSVNVSPTEDLAMLFVYPGNSGHDYGSIEHQGFRKLIVERDGKPTIVDNPRWLPPEERRD